jgi:hypothetical protein
MVRKRLAGVAMLADEAIEEHQRVKELLAEIDGLDANSAGTKTKVAELERCVQHHVTEEETEVFPALEVRCSAGDLEDLGEKLARSKSMSPTHPHAPATPPGNVVAGPAAAAIGRVRDAITGK